MRVVANCAISLDGRLTSARGERTMLGSSEDRRRMGVLRTQADAVLVGGATFRTWRVPLVAQQAWLGTPVPPRSRPIINAVLTRQGLLGQPWSRFPDPRVSVQVYGPPSLAAPAHEAALGAVVFARVAPTPGWVLSELAEQGCETVLVEGGGGLLAPLLAAGLVDELFVTVCPLLLGGAAPSLVDGPGFSVAEAPRLALVSQEILGDEVFLHYRVRTNRATASV